MHLVLLVMAFGAGAWMAGRGVSAAGEGVDSAGSGLVKVAVAGGAGWLLWKAWQRR